MSRRSGLSWAIGVIAPWWLGAGVLVSFTADAGQRPAEGWSLSPFAARAGSRSALYGRVHSARLEVGDADDLDAPPDEREPHVALKQNVQHFPEVDRRHKGDPLIALRPTFESWNGETVALAPGADGESTIAAFAPGEDALDAADAGDRGAPTTQRGAGEASPRQRGTATTQRVVSNEATKARAAHGATPQTPRAAALASSTPAQREALPVEVASFSHATAAPMGARHPDYASLIDPAKLEREKRCLAEAVYFEARSEPETGQAAVAQVVLNRVSSGLYPSNVCGVVYQNRTHYKACQFSFACEGRRLRIAEPEAWASATRVADEVMKGETYISDVGGSTHYHANYVKPRWAKALKRTDKIGNHIFYRLRPGQT
ncbi:cell wall hydrolase [Methylosinus sp. Sm6]|uniref:cell wall hydrolase n=1 Tax=Methylosinus sp. Sm6 TaxID=2866948 RepID=UPI001C99AE41|nr:cell wall hydrolase [Methylosinus sp. Sm6]MBY6243242.1 cell wall hydrolase [Methylosinus sp. Sm6]